jgi:hypothetical protein
MPLPAIKIIIVVAVVKKVVRFLVLVLARMSGVEGSARPA